MLRITEFPNLSDCPKKEDQQQPPSHHHHHHQPPPPSFSVPSFRARPHLPAWRAWRAARAAASQWPWATRRQIPCASRRPAAKPRWPRRSCNSWHRFRHHGWGGCCWCILVVVGWLFPVGNYFLLCPWCWVFKVSVLFLRLDLGIGLLSGGDEELTAFQNKRSCVWQGSWNYLNLGESNSANAWWLGNDHDFPYFIVPCLSC